MADATEYWLATLNYIEDREASFTIGLYRNEEAARAGVAAELQQQADENNEGLPENDADRVTADGLRGLYEIEVFALRVLEDA